MSEVTMDGFPVRVGDRVWWEERGVWGEVVKILDPEENSYPINVKWENGTGSWITPKGQMYDWLPREIYWDKPNRIPPKPKQKISKWQWIFERHDGKYGMTDQHFHSREEVAKVMKQGMVIIDAYTPSLKVFEE